MASAIDALKTLSSFAGWSEARIGTLEITGDDADPILPTPFRFGETSTAALACVGLAASDLWALRTGRHQQIGVNVRQATASLRSTKYLRINGVQSEKPEGGIAGVYPAKNGRWSYLHCNFPNHRDAALRVLNVDNDKEAVRRAVAGWDALELEEAIIAAGGAGGMARSMDEWARHPQSIAVGSLPVIEIIKIGPSPAERLPAGDRPLSGIRVLDLTRVIAGPTCARTLAEHGADVLKISGPSVPGMDRQDLETGHGKLSAQLDLEDPKDLETLRELVRECDVFSQGYRPGSLAAHGLAPEALAALRPGIVAVSLSAFSHLGPWAMRRGFDTVVQTVSGISLRQGELFPGKQPGPQFYPASAVDFLAGYLMAFGTMVALARRTREGGSWLVRTSLAQVGRWLVERGQVEESHLLNVAPEFTNDELASWTMETESPAGKLHHMKPVLHMSETPPAWTRPAVPLGFNAPSWPARR